MNKSLTKKTKIRTLAVLLLTVIVLLFSFGAISKTDRAGASEAQVALQEEWKEEYAVGSVWTAPASAKIQVGDAILDVVNTYLVYPDGKIYDKDTYELDQTGCYTAYFFANYNGREVSAQKEFFVYSHAHSVPDGAVCEYKEQLTMTDEAVSGLSVRLAEGTAYEYGATIDISNADLTTPLATIYSFNSSMREGGAGYNKLQSQILVLRLTDAYDETNYVDIELSFDVEGYVNKTKLRSQGLVDQAKIDAAGKTYDELTDAEIVDYLKDGVDLGDARMGDYRYGRYFRAGTSEVLPRGFKKNSTGNKTSWPVIEYEEGVYYDICHRTTYLGNVWGPYGAEAVHNPLGNDPVEFYFDYDTCKVYAQTYDAKGTPKMTFVSDLRCKDAYTTPFKGFTTGEVRLSIFGEWYKQSYVNFEVSSVYGVSGEALRKETAHETNAPVIKAAVENETHGEIVIAKNEPFSVFSYDVVDVSPIKESVVKVYYQYGSEQETVVGVKDGKFTPKNVGEYTIVYAARDIYGNYAEKHVSLNSVECPNGQSLYLALAKDGDVSLNASETVQLDGGKTYQLPTYEIQSANRFETTLSMYLLHESDTSKKIAVDEKENVLTLYELGGYTLVYEYKDAVQTKKTCFELNSNPSNEVALKQTPILPRYFIKDSKCSLELGETISFATAGATVNPDVFVSFDGGVYEQVDANNVEITGKQNIKVKYAYGEKVLYETKNALPIVDVGYADSLDMSKYFLGNFYKDVNENRIQFAAKKTSGSETLEFINPISFANFKFAFEVLPEYANFEYLAIEFTDYYNKENKLTVVYGKTATGSYYEIGGSKYEFTQPFASSNQLSYESDSQEFKTYSGSTMGLSNPFEKDKVYMTVTLHNITDESAVDISRINGQIINETSMDVVKADFTLVHLSGTYKVGSKLTVPKPYITDVLSPYLACKFLLTVETPSGEYYKDENGKTYVNVAMDTETVDIMLSSYGLYRIRYTYTDSDAYLNKDSRLVDVYVTDSEAPIISIAGGYNEETVLSGKVGDTVTPAGYTVTDNVTSADKLYVNIVIVSPDNIMDTVTDGKGYTFYMKGVYVVYYMCLDEAGNYATVSYNIEVE